MPLPCGRCCLPGQIYLHFLSRLRVPGTVQANWEILWDSYAERSIARNWEDFFHASQLFKHRL